MTLAERTACYDSCRKPYVKQSNKLDTDNLSLETSIDDDHNDDDGNSDDGDELCRKQTS